MTDLACSAYTGVDISEVVIEKARAAHPAWTFLAGDFLVLTVPKADIVVCLDVLIHQPEFEAYAAFVRKLVDNARRTLIVSAYLQRPWFVSDITFYYESLTETLRRFLQKPSMEIIGGYRDTSIVKVSIASSS